ncbi:MAG TPA: hypothetical protein VJA94_12315 [Candidatus Angelobacter sp.]
MRVHWEKLGILGPVYRLVGREFGNDEIAGQLKISEANVRRCVAWLMRFGGHSSRAELVLEAFAAIPLDGEHRIASAMSEVDSVSGDICQLADHGKPHRVAAAIQPGTMLMREGFLLPDSAQIETLDYSSTWRVLAEMDSSNLGQRLSLAGFHLFFIAGELKVVQLGSGPQAVRRGIKRMLALSCKNYLNCTEITQITPEHFLGVPYVAILAHSFHIQAGTELQSSAERRSEQNQSDWACS